MNEYEAMKLAIEQLQDEVHEGKARIDGLTHDLTIARETITDVARVRDDFFESLSARDADVVTLERERDSWKEAAERERGWKEDKNKEWAALYKKLGEVRSERDAAQADARELAVCLKRLFDTVEWVEVTNEYIGKTLSEHGARYL
jgi:chromosome segregation ATPase